MSGDCMSKASLIERINSVINGLTSLDQKNEESGKTLIGDGTKESWSVGIAINLLHDYRRMVRDHIPDEKTCNFVTDLIKLINNYSMENKSDTPDFILGHYLLDSLKSFNNATTKRTDWYSCDRDPCEPELCEAGGPTKEEDSEARYSEFREMLTKGASIVNENRSVREYPDPNDSVPRFDESSGNRIKFVGESEKE